MPNLMFFTAIRLSGITSEITEPEAMNSLIIHTRKSGFACIVLLSAIFGEWSCVCISPNIPVAIVYPRHCQPMPRLRNFTVKKSDGDLVPNSTIRTRLYCDIRTTKTVLKHWARLNWLYWVHRQYGSIVFQLQMQFISEPVIAKPQDFAFVPRKAVC